MNKDLTTGLKQHAVASGIDLIGITSADPFIIQKEKETVADPKDLLSNARAIVITGFYMKDNNNIPDESVESRGRFSAYNVKIFTPMQDYHRKIIKSFLEREGYRVEPDEYSKIPYKMAAVRTGLGKYGKNSVVITKKYGSFVMFVAHVTNAPLNYEEFPVDKTDCDECEICIKSCPTRAIYAPFKLKRNLCITDWLWGSFVPINLRRKQENRLFGCGECVSVCPKNEKFKPRKEFPVLPEDVSSKPELIPLIAAENKYYKKLIASFPLLAGIDAIRGNAIIALGNAGSSTCSTSGDSAVNVLKKALKHVKPQIRAYSACALGRLNKPEANNILQKTLLVEKDDNVIKEIQYALGYSKK
ncbi:MAG: 4Fe-4S double cluster binding domain-containing protein [Actinomycetota bacterium]